MTRISVIIPTYNRIKTVLECIQSVQEQTHSAHEIIVVDDASTDNSCIQIQQKFPHIKLIQNSQNEGVSYSRNLGVANATGNWIAFLDSDDQWQKKKLEKQVQFIQENPDIQILQTEEIWIRNGKQVNPPKKYKKEQGWIYEKSLTLCTISPSSVILTKELFEQEQGFDTQLRACEDYDLWLRITEKQQIGLLQEALLIKYGGHQDQLSQKYPAMDRFRIYSMVKVLSQKDISLENQETTLEMLSQKLHILKLGAQKRNVDITTTVEKLYDIGVQKQFLQYHQFLIQELLHASWIEINHQ
ncbi:MAG: glycosyltransferase involved in cell wall biosynthesis [bacterium]|jgi:glycosyltransferase involved in cell wall biosynthesis